MPGNSSDTESEILLGNKHLAAIFFVVALLIGIAFTGGYMVGRNSAPKKSASGEAGATATSTDTGGETRIVQPAGAATAESPSASKSLPQKLDTDQSQEDTPLGTPKQKKAPGKKPEDEGSTSPSSGRAGGFVPEAGQTFLQVAAVNHEEADAIADVLHKKGFQAHSVPAPGNARLYRVLIGPLKDAGELSTTRDSLRKTGFREVIVRHY